MVEIDTSKTIYRKRRILEANMGTVPEYLGHVPLDFNVSHLATAFRKSVRNDLKTVSIWQGVSYYVPFNTVSSVLDVVAAFTPKR